MEFTFYYDVVCPYAYLASTRVEALAARCDATIRWVPILLGGVFRHAGGPADPNQTMSPARARMNLVDMHRWADRWGVPLTMPGAHPRRTVEAMRLLVGCPPEKRVMLSHALFRAYWVRGADIADRTVLEETARLYRIDPAVIDSAEARQALYDTTREAADAGVFGVPAFVVDGELIWGQDRLHLLADRLGATRPTGSTATPVSSGGVVRFFHDFGSPYSYLASTQVERVARASGAVVDWRPMLLGALFRDIGTGDVPLFAMSPPKRRYMAKDLDDWAAWWGVPFRFPEHFPLRTIAPLRVAIAEPEVTPHLYRAAWAEDRSIDDPEVLAAVLDEAGFDGAALLERTQDPKIKARLRANTEAAKDAGACGAPTFLVRRGDETPQLFWGQDRLEMVGHALDGWRPPEVTP